MSPFHQNLQDFTRLTFKETLFSSRFVLRLNHANADLDLQGAQWPPVGDKVTRPAYTATLAGSGCQKAAPQPGQTPAHRGTGFRSSSAVCSIFSARVL